MDASTLEPTRTAVAAALSIIALSALPPVGQPLDGGIFVGLTTRADGTHCAVVLLEAQPASRLTWSAAMAWAKEAGGELPTRPAAALLFANVRGQLQPRWHWTADEEGESYAWHCYFDDGTQFYVIRSAEGSAVAVRMIPLSA